MSKSPSWRTDEDADPSSPFRLASGLLLLVLIGLAFLLFLLKAGDKNLPSEWLFQVLILFPLSSLFGLGLLLLKNLRKSAFLVMALQSFMFLILNYPEGGDIALACLFVTLFVLELTLFLEMSLPWILLWLPLFLFLLWIRPIPVWGLVVAAPGLAETGILILVSVVALVAFFAVRKLDSELRRLRQEVKSLNRSVGTLLNANLDFQNYAVQVGELSTMEERRRLTREIHDVVGYTLINLKMMLESALDLASEKSSRLPELLTDARDEVQNGLVETRSALRVYREMVTKQEVGLSRLVKLVNSFSHATGIKVVLNYGNVPWSFGETLDSAVYRTVQESMTNAFRHGRATRIQINFWVASERLLITIDDNGNGSGKINPGIGLTGMRERLEPLGGTLVVAGDRKGFSLKIEIPTEKGGGGSNSENQGAHRG